MSNKSSKKIVREKYIRFSEEINALDYLEKAYSYIKSVEQNPQDWKWIIISLYGSLYGFAICAVQGTNSQTVTYTLKNGERRLISFPDAIEWCQDKNKMTWTVMSKELILTEDQKHSIDYLLKVFRHNFEHFTPKSWSIEIHGFPHMAIDVLEVIRFLALDTGNYVHLTKTQRKKVKSLIYQSRRVIKASMLYRESLIARKHYREKMKKAKKK